MPRVLVVDDTASIRLLIRSNLELAGFEVDEAADGVDCLEQLAAAETLPDAITIDVMMPRMDGISTVTSVRHDERTSHIAIVMVSTQNHPATIQRATDAGVDHYLIKPFDPDELVDVLHRVIAERSVS